MAFLFSKLQFLFFELSTSRQGWFFLFIDFGGTNVSIGESNNSKLSLVSITLTLAYYMGLI